MCSYCGCLDISVIGDLAREHEAIINATDALRRAARDRDRVTVHSAADTLSALLDPHTEGEERGLFRELGSLTEFSEHVSSVCDEQGELEASLVLIKAGDLAVVDPFILKLRLHIDREENGLFPAAAVAFDGDAWQRIVRVSATPASLL